MEIETFTILTVIFMTANMGYTEFNIDLYKYQIFMFPILFYGLSLMYVSFIPFEKLSFTIMLIINIIGLLLFITTFYFNKKGAIYKIKWYKYRTKSSLEKEAYKLILLKKLSILTNKEEKRLNEIMNKIVTGEYASRTDDKYLINKIEGND